MNIDFWFEFASTYSYPAAMRIEQLAATHGISVSWRPFLLGPIFREQGWDNSPFNLQQAKGRYMWRDVERVCTSYNLSFRRPSEFPRNGLLAARVACRFASEPWLPKFVRAIYHANFVDDHDISQPATILECLDGCGDNQAALLEEAQSPESKLKLREQTERAKQAGIFGAPSFVVGTELFWGNDRLEAALQWAADR